MSDEKKAAVLQVKNALLLALESSAPTVGLPAGVRVETNPSAVSRFPLAVALPSAAAVALGAIMIMKGFRVIGGAFVVLGLGGVAASAAAPELHAQLQKLGAT